ncbi:MAG: glycoside hydrolase family 16 protein [Clostridiales bacterium]|jgi:hypothetical protein|nr:glycoside hydrolase family 16 protein [Clostridiales bacterium]
MSKKKKVFIVVASVLLVCVGFSIAGYFIFRFDPAKADASPPDFETAGFGIGNANDEGWYAVFIDEFEGDRLNGEIWTTSPHGVRKRGATAADTSWWCPSMVSVEDGKVVIRAQYLTDHICPDGVCVSEGIFTGGIETRKIVENADSSDPDVTKGNHDELLFGQAFGYFETSVKFPEGEGIWSAFWLQSSNQRKLFNRGADGTEIDIYESAFVKDPTLHGNALLWNGYSNALSGVADNIFDAGKNLYGEYHKFALKWTPEYYVFYIDDTVSWITNAGGVSKVKEFLRLTVEVDEGDGWGPHARKIGLFDKTKTDYAFYVDYVKVYQNKNFAKYEKPDSYYKGPISNAN